MAFAALAVVMSSCSGDDGGGGGSSLDTYVNATVDGAAFKTFSVQGQSLGSALKTGTGDQTLISVTGSSMQSATDTNVKSINITLMGITTTGTYEINANTQSLIAYVDSALGLSWDTSNCDAATGTITVTTLTDAKIEGTFSFTGVNDDNCADQKVVTNGKFRGTFITN